MLTRNTNTKKGDKMKGLMIISMFGVIIFLIAAFFAFFAFDKLVSNELVCVLQFGKECAGNMNNTFTFGLTIILTMMIMMVSAVYVMVKNISVDIKYITEEKKKRR